MVEFWWRGLTLLGSTSFRDLCYWLGFRILVAVVYFLSLFLSVIFFTQD